MQTITIEQDEATHAQLLNIQTALLEIKEDLKFLKSKLKPKSSGVWLPASAFCREYGVTRPTLKSYVERGLVIAKDFGDDRPRYKWTEKEDKNVR